jgi:hypothetical protein
MFELEYYIDQLQKTKMRVFNTVVKDPVLRSAAENYVNAQAAFAKMLVSNTRDLAFHSYDIVKDFYDSKKFQGQSCPYKVETPSENQQ